jgi:hypothetical protein
MPSFWLPTQQQITTVVYLPCLFLRKRRNMTVMFVLPGYISADLHNDLRGAPLRIISLALRTWPYFPRLLHFLNLLNPQISRLFYMNSG